MSRFILTGSADTDRAVLLAFKMSEKFLVEYPYWGSPLLTLKCRAPECVEVNDEGRVVGLMLENGAVLGERLSTVLSLALVFPNMSLGESEPVNSARLFTETVDRYRVLNWARVSRPL